MGNLKEPIAFQVFRDGKWRTVCKITKLKNKDKWVLAKIYRTTKPLGDEFSIPAQVIEFAKKNGVKEIYYADETNERYRKISILKFIAYGRKRADEIFFRVSDMDETEKPEWEYAKKTIKLSPIENIKGSEVILV